MISESDYTQTEFGKIPPNWKLLTVNDIKATEKKAIISGPFGSSISSKYFVQSGIPVIRGNNLANGLTRFIDDGFVFITAEKANELGTWALENDIVFTAAGTLGQVGIIENHSRFDKYIISNKQLRLRVNENIVRPLYVFYWFSSPRMISYIQQRDTGSTIPLINLSVLRSLPILVPPLNIQDAIINILDSIDSKLFLNQKIQANIEKVAQTLFKLWFVDFEFPNEDRKPYKSSGGKMVSSEFGDVPKDWTLSELGDIVEFAYGKALNEKVRNPGTVPVYGSNGPIGWHDQPLVKGPGIIIGRKGNPGTVSLSIIDFFPIDTTFYVVPRKQITNVYFLFHFLKLQDLPLLSADSAVPGLNRNIAYRNKCMAPNLELVETFGKRVNIFYTYVNLNDTNSRTLLEIRDILLPRLLSGEIRIRDAEKVIGLIK